MLLELYHEEGVIDDVFFNFTSPEAAGQMVGNPFGTTSSWRKRGIQSMSEVWNMLTSRASNVNFDHFQITNDRRSGFIKAFDRSPTPKEIEKYNQSKAEKRKLSEIGHKKRVYE